MLPLLLGVMLFIGCYAKRPMLPPLHNSIVQYVVYQLQSCHKNESPLNDFLSFHQIINGLKPTGIFFRYSWKIPNFSCLTTIKNAGIFQPAVFGNTAFPKAEAAEANRVGVGSRFPMGNGDRGAT